MDYKAKQKLFAEFMDEWGEQFSKVQPIINYLSSYPIMIEKTRLMGTFVEEGLEEHQLEWISLIAQLYHPLDRNFFKPYWVPIFKDRYDFFIDISNPGYPIFEQCYFWLKPYDYYKAFISFEIDKVLACLDENENYIHEMFEMYRKDRSVQFNDLCEFHKVLKKQNK
ncbi:MAG: hypothetical protein PF486_11930 [Prolixibacteraceae bacterium]|jgi:hypothetical protein|nr:hypothetical protein [Prolixibacteraceae bacterium]